MYIIYVFAYVVYVYILVFTYTTLYMSRKNTGRMLPITHGRVPDARSFLE